MDFFNSSFFNIFSILLGLLSVLFAIYNIITVSKKSRLHNSFLATLSMVACVLSLYFQILWTGHLISSNNLSSLIDRYGVTRFATTLLVIITFTLNIIGFILAKTNKVFPPKPVVSDVSQPAVSVSESPESLNSLEENTPNQE